MAYNHAISEIIGAIALMGIIVAAFGIFSAIYLPMIKPTQIPLVKMSVACDEHISNFDPEFPCTRASFSCHPNTDPFDKETCEMDCIQRDYSRNQQNLPNDPSLDTLRCLEYCLAPMCSNLTNCGVIYICHNGGDMLDMQNMKIFVNSQKIDQSNLEKKEISNNSFIQYNNLVNKTFEIGTIIRIQNPPRPVDEIMISYTLSSGSEVTLVLNQFGTDVL